MSDVQNPSALKLRPLALMLGWVRELSLGQANLSPLDEVGSDSEGLVFLQPLKEAQIAIECELLVNAACAHDNHDT